MLRLLPWIFLFLSPLSIVLTQGCGIGEDSVTYKNNTCDPLCTADLAHPSNVTQQILSSKCPSSSSGPGQAVSASVLSPCGDTGCTVIICCTSTLPPDTTATSATQPPATSNPTPPPPTTTQPSNTPPPNTTGSPSSTCSPAPSQSPSDTKYPPCEPGQFDEFYSYSDDNCSDRGCDSFTDGSFPLTCSDDSAGTNGYVYNTDDSDGGSCTCNTIFGIPINSCPQTCYLHYCCGPASCPSTTTTTTTTTTATTTPSTSTFTSSSASATPSSCVSPTASDTLIGLCAAQAACDANKQVSDAVTQACTPIDPNSAKAIEDYLTSIGNTIVTVYNEKGVSVESAAALAEAAGQAIATANKNGVFKAGVFGKFFATAAGSFVKSVATQGCALSALDGKISTFCSKWTPQIVTAVYGCTCPAVNLPLSNPKLLKRATGGHWSRNLNRRAIEEVTEPFFSVSRAFEAAISTRPVNKKRGSNDCTSALSLLSTNICSRPDLSGYCSSIESSASGSTQDLSDAVAFCSDYEALDTDQYCQFVAALQAFTPYCDASTAVGPSQRARAKLFIRN